MLTILFLLLSFVVGACSLPRWVRLSSHGLGMTCMRESVCGGAPTPLLFLYHQKRKKNNFFHWYYCSMHQWRVACCSSSSSSSLACQARTTTRRQRRGRMTWRHWSTGAPTPSSTSRYRQNSLSSIHSAVPTRLLLFISSLTHSPILWRHFLLKTLNRSWACTAFRISVNSSKNLSCVCFCRLIRIR